MTSKNVKFIFEHLLQEIYNRQSSIASHNRQQERAGQGTGVNLVGGGQKGGVYSFGRISSSSCATIVPFLMAAAEGRSVERACAWRSSRHCTVQTHDGRTQ